MSAFMIIFVALRGEAFAAEFTDERLFPSMGTYVENNIELFKRNLVTMRALISFPLIQMVLFDMLL